MNLMTEQVAKVPLHRGSVYALCGGASEEEFYSAGSEGIVAKWNLQHINEATAAAKVDGQVFALLYQPLSNCLVMGTMSGGIHALDLNTRKELHYITYHEQSVFDLKEHQGKIYAASKDGTLTVWNGDSFQLERVLVISDQSLRCIAIHREANLAAVGCSDNHVYLLDLEEYRIISKLAGPANSVFSACFLDDDRLAVGSRDAQLYVFDMKSQELVRHIKAHLYTINHIISIPEQKLFITASRDKTIRIWNSDTFDLLKSLDKEKYDGHINSVNKLLWIPSRNYLVSVSDDRAVIIWKITF
jgi:WD40 repeat protein